VKPSRVQFLRVNSNRHMDLGQTISPRGCPISANFWPWWIPFLALGVASSCGRFESLKVRVTLPILNKSRADSPVSSQSSIRSDIFQKLAGARAQILTEYIGLPDL
jgi:hypothetical protein